MKKLLNVAGGLIIICMLAACGADGGTSGKDTSTVKSVDDVLKEQVAQNETEEISDDTTEEIAYTEEATTQSDTREIDAVNETLDEAKEQAAASASDGIDVDLTKLSSTMIYSEVYNMVTTPDEYYGKKIRIAGNTVIYHDDTDGNDYYACVIKDATQCCAQGIEFVLKDGNYPEADAEITVTGTFSSYKIEDMEYYTLLDAVVE